MKVRYSYAKKNQLISDKVKDRFIVSRCSKMPPIPFHVFLLHLTYYEITQQHF